MCKIKEVTGFKLNEVIHPTRDAAVLEGLAEVVADIQQKHARDMREGLIENKDKLLYLLDMHGKPEMRAKPSFSERQHEGIPRDNVSHRIQAVDDVSDLPAEHW